MKLSVYALIPVAIFSTLHGVILIVGRKLRCQAASIAAPHALSKAQAIMRELLGEAHRVRVEVMEDLCPIIIQLVDGDECVCVSVAPSFFELEGRGVADLFTIYGLLLDYVRDDATLCVNMWNVLCSLTERRLEDLLVRDKGMMHDDCKDVQAVASLLSSQYNIQRWLPPSWCRHAKRAPHELLAVTRRGQHSKFHAALLFSRTVMHSCTPAIVGVAALLILANNLRSFITTLSYADVDELSLVELLAEQSSVETTSMLAFFSVSRHRRMLEIMTTVFVAEAFFPFISGVTEAFSKYLTSWYSRHMHSVVYAAMARRDYLSTSDKFCLDVENAIIMVTDFSLVNVSYLIDHTLTKLTYLRMLYVAPVLCGITAMGEVWLNEMRHHWARAECLYTLFSLKSDKTCGPDTTDAAPPPSAQDVVPVVGESPRGVPVSVDEINQLFAMQRSTGEEGKHWQYTQPPSRLGAKSLPGSVLIPLLRHINTAPTISALAVDGEALATFNNPSDATSFLSVVPDVVDYVVRDAPPMIFCGDVTPYHYDILAQKDGMDGGKEPFVEGMEVLNRLRAESPKIDVSWTNLLRAPDGPWSVEMVDVWFAYPGQTTYALREVSFSIHAGGCVGIIGYSGAGKSTFLALLARLYLPQRGHIFINAIPIEHFAARELRRRIGNVWQETTSMRFLTDENVGNNLAYGNLRHASTSNIHSALNDAGMTDAVLRRGRGLHEMISHNCFSGGEYERLSIARSFVNRDACLRILDEPTSALDSSTESMILQNIRRPPQGSTDSMQATLMFATHRISSVKDADLILVIAGGKVVEQGSWALLSREGNPHFHTLLEAHALPR